MASIWGAGRTQILSEINQLDIEDEGIVEDLGRINRAERIVYAIDFHEVHAFTFYDRGSEALIYSFLHNASDLINQIAFNETVSEEILFSGNYNLIMLPGHRLELARLVRSIRYAGISDLSYIWDRVERSVSDILALRSEFEPEIKILASGGSISAQALSLLLDRIQNKAPELFLLTRRSIAEPIDRLRKFVHQTRLMDTERFLSAVVPEGRFNSDLYHYALERFIARRPKRPLASNKVDAHAVAYLSWLNMTTDDKTHFRLIARSAAMRDVFQDIAASEKYNESFGNWLRAPRTFGALRFARLAGIELSEFFRSRKELRNLIRIILHDPQEKMSIENWRRRLALRDEKLNELDESFRAVARLTIAGNLSASIWNSSDGRKFIGQYFDLEELLKLLLGATGVKEAFQRRASVIVSNALRSTIDAIDELVVPGEQDTDVTILVSDEVRDSSEAVVQAPVRLTLTSVGGDLLYPYALDFFSKELKELRDEGRSGWSMLQKFVRSSMQAGNFEAFLGFALLLACRAEWQLAFSLANLAVMQVKDDERARCFEAYYFRSVCRRFSGLGSGDELQQSLSDLIFALQSKMNGRGEVSRRFLNEYAITVGLMKKRSVVFGGDLPFGSNEMEIWRTLRDQAVDIEEKIRYQNNIVFTLVGADEELTLRSEFAELLRLGEALGKEHMSRRMLINHTILLARRRLGLFGPSTADELDAQIEILERSKFMPKIG